MITAKLFYIIGPSGAGKDSLIEYIRQRCTSQSGIAVAHRYITRNPDAGGENHVALSKDEFIYRKKSGLFAMDWHRHETHYGIGIEVEHWLLAGMHVVVNGSRSYLPEAEKRFENLCPIFVHVDIKVLRERLLSRGRESVAQIEKRLAKAREDESYYLSRDTILKVENNGSLAEAGENLWKLIGSDGNLRELATLR